ncbi:MAG: hypothetical protein RIA63_05730 [Cyclobacteriaceae bacterium]
MKSNLKLDPDKIVVTVELLEKRIAERFPDSGLGKIAKELLAVARDTKTNIAWISKPNILLRSVSYLVILMGVVTLIYTFTLIDLRLENNTLSSVVQTIEAVFNDIVLLGAAIFFLTTIETRVKRQRAIKLLNELRVIAHVIDMHQLTKDPSMMRKGVTSTVSSPKRMFTKFELQRYLDYCSEAIALLSKVAVLYSQSLSDEIVVKSVTEIEVLSTGLSRKVWQKLIILNDIEEDEMNLAVD